MTTPALSPGHLSGRDWAALLVLCGAIFLEGSDVAMLTVALPSIRTDLGLATSELGGVLTAYVVGYGGFMLLGGRAADLYGRRRMFVLWLVVFLVFSGLGGLATEGWMLLVARLVTGIAAGFLTPAGLSLITTQFPEGPRRNRALIIYGAAGAAGFSLGLVVGGLLSAIHWRWVFFAPVVLSVVLLVLAVAVIRRDAPDRGRGRLDAGGALTATGAMVLLAFGIVRLEHLGDEPVPTLGALAGGLALLVVFVLLQRRSPDPLVRLGLLRCGVLVRANITALAFAGAFYGFQFLLTLYLQEMRGWTPLQTGLAMLLMAIDAVLAPTLTPRLVERFGVARVIVGGGLAAFAAVALFAFARLDWVYALMVPSMLLVGVAFALAYGPLAIAATDGVAEREQGVASGLLNTSFQLGAAIGISTATLAFTVTLAGQGSAAVQLAAFRVALVVPAALALVAATTMVLRARRRPLGADAPDAPETRAEVRVPG
ncbi:major facilitator superfamily MFS_1 [Beutenbergia cavernae DSM 12333]|uniref:Major facilitator superfamily MFS_1 n=1 Tax=Beutenbergia cavernae (strain ATCC BAA-8 / DSM 12333 / CCUG 43141 / JCM 11478 / NBRC 16432 / NCIMB 13614 / HKI 0122) TaxID=471853 RepID=C5C3S7_BEUC1|nr:MFS transporter [Beutenbergia cavernae]ACQ81986.1 major facilitator superfamily MFS_1 [Beutenbergia cavernae DSM 12333]